MIPVLRKTLAVASLAVLSAAGPVSGAHAAPTLTAASVFSTNSEGNNWNGLIWNTLGTPQEAALSSPSAPPDRWNLSCAIRSAADSSTVETTAGRPFP